jgi:hypothetical protein
MRATIGVTALVILLAASIPATAQNYAAESLDRWFRLEWTAGGDAKGPQLSGYVYNTTNRRATRMRLAIDGLDPDGHVMAHTETCGGASLRLGGRRRRSLPALVGERPCRSSPPSPAPTRRSC